MRAPRMITIPILLNVPENPAPIMLGIFVRGIPTTIASMSEMPMRAINGCSLNLLIATIITTIAITNEIIRPTPDIFHLLI